MEMLRFDGPLDETLRAPVLVVVLDGWTDAGRAGTIAAELLRAQWDGRRIGRFDPDGLFDYRDRRPLLTIDEGRLGEPQWPALEVFQLSPTGGTQGLLVHGSEPDLAWQALCRDLVELARLVGTSRYVGLGAVPGPVPHTRDVQLLTTGSREDLVDQLGLPHAQLVVPASCQAVVETALRDAGLVTVGMWARVPHYVAGEYPAAAHALLDRLGSHLGTALDLAGLAQEAEEHRQRLDVAASSSPEVVAHIQQLESAYDENLPDQFGLSGSLPTGDEIAAELERFLRGQGNAE